MSFFENCFTDTQQLQDYDAVMNKVAEAEELSADHRPSTLEKLAELASDTSAPKSSARSAPEL